MCDGLEQPAENRGREMKRKKLRGKKQKALPVTNQGGTKPEDSARLRMKAEANVELLTRPRPPAITIEFPTPVHTPGEGMTAIRTESTCCVCAGQVHERLADETLDQFEARIRALYPRKTIVMEPPYIADLENRTEFNPFPGSPMALAKATLSKRGFFEWRFRQQ